MSDQSNRNRRNEYLNLFAQLSQELLQFETRVQSQLDESDRPTGPSILEARFPALKIERTEQIARLKRILQNSERAGISSCVDPVACDAAVAAFAREEVDGSASVDEVLAVSSLLKIHNYEVANYRLLLGLAEGLALSESERLLRFSYEESVNSATEIAWIGETAVYAKERLFADQ